MNYSNFHAEQDITNIIEETFDTCSSNKDELYWIISLLRGFLNIPNKRHEPVKENYQLNMWQYQIHPILQNFRKKWKCISNGRKETTW